MKRKRNLCTDSDMLLHCKIYRHCHQSAAPGMCLVAAKHVSSILPANLVIYLNDDNFFVFLSIVAPIGKSPALPLEGMLVCVRVCCV